ncbi:PREDICTED: WAT1-related protein At5g64700-like isoform X2 [Ipomoea nil]|uniref:WAT1-related protein At5g64700-like isoform X2 n=1 Tax=Ipomoea nil TaxID=35883 RepID=UPI000900F525|nr:PREDICTED: WAT1-related protein At5g64700-like isoform X2 [Ipomoea nil]
MEGGGLRLLLGMLFVQAVAAGLQLLSKVILGQGTFVYALMTYRHIVATFCVAPFAFTWERESLKKLNLSVVMWLFLVSLSGICMAMGFFYLGLRDTTATVEKLRLNTKGGKVKLMGAMICLAGALTIALYKGKTFHFSHTKAVAAATHQVMKPNWKRGTIFLVCSCLSYGFWFITQAKLFKKFPYMYSATTVISMIATFQSMVIGLCIDRNKESWKLGWNLQLITILYSGTLATAATFCLMSWAISKTGPTYPSMFNPLSLILVAITEVIFLGASISIGSLIGMAFIIAGLYLFLWGKNMEMKNSIKSNTTKSLGQLIAGEGGGLQATAAGAVVPSSLTYSSNEHCSAVVVPASSPSYDDCIEIETGNNNEQVN